MMYPNGMPTATQDAPDYTAEVARRTAHVFKNARNAITEQEWPHLAADIDSILRLKAARNAVVLAHNYQTRDIYHCISDITGDSLALARAATEVEADVIIVCGVHFMAETAKILNPEKTVLIPDPEAGCSLAESITAADVRALKAQHPGIPVVTYVNTSAAVKAESDACCTSANAQKVVEAMSASWGIDKAILIPDEFLAKNVAAETHVEIITFPGRCEVHERFTLDQVRRVRQAHPIAAIIAHPECPPEVVSEADFSGSTQGMADYIKTKKPEEAVLITECSMSSNLAAEYPDTNFVRSCHLCPHMQKITLEKVSNSLLTMGHEVTIDPDIADRARASIQAMLDIV